MKSKLLVVFLILSFFSCSDDDNSEKKISQIQVYGMYGDQQASYEFDDQNRVTIVVYYDELSHNQTNKAKYSYNEYGVSTINIYSLASGTEKPTYTYTFEYNSDGWLITALTTPAADLNGTKTLFNYSYTADGVITCTQDYSNGGIFKIKYYRNSLGQIYKITNDNGLIQEATYDGDNLSSYTFNGEKRTLSFDEAHMVKGHHLNLEAIGTLQNTILYQGVFLDSMGYTKYVTNITDTNGAIFNYKYKFTGDDYLYEAKMFTTSNLQLYKTWKISYK